MYVIEVTVPCLGLCIPQSVKYISPHGTSAPRGSEPPNYQTFTITLRHTKRGRTPLDAGSAVAEAST